MPVRLTWIEQWKIMPVPGRLIGSDREVDTGCVAACVVRLLLCPSVLQKMSLFLFNRALRVSPFRSRREQVDGANCSDGRQLRYLEAVREGAAHHEEGRGAARRSWVRFVQSESKDTAHHEGQNGVMRRV